MALFPVTKLLPEVTLEQNVLLFFFNNFIDM